MKKNNFDAVVFDLDGVITKTATTHSRAWKKMFDQYLLDRSKKNNEQFIEFTPNDYLTFVDGKPRYEGVKSFLESRKIELPFGTPEDDTNQETVCGLGNRKNEAFNDVLKKEGVEVYPSTVRFLEQLKADNIRIGVASSSKNCEAVLNAAGLMHFVETRVDGVVSAEIGLSGKPAPDIFLTAAKNLGVDINKTIVVEDAVSGVKAGKNGNFGLVIGLAREDNNEALKANGADIVVNDLEEISLEEINAWFLDGIDDDNWSLSYFDYVVDKEKSREALLTVGNGYMGTRGAMEETSSGSYNNPGTYIAGLYNRLTTKIADKDIVNEDFVSAPNWLSLTFKIEDEPWYNPNTSNIEEIWRKLDFRTGVLSKFIIVTDDENHRTKIESKRIVSMDNPHQAAISYTITPLNYSGQITFSSNIDGTIINEGVERYKSLNSKHLKPVSQGGEGNVSWLEVVTNQSNIKVAEVAKLNIKSKNISSLTNTTDEGIVYTYVDVVAEQNQPITIEKLVAVYDSNNTPGDVKQLAISCIDSVSSFSQMQMESENAWKKIWDEIDIKLEGDRMSQKMLRLHMYHLMVSASPHNKNIDAGITARGLHGEAYRGHIFWDELFILPFYDVHFPTVAKSMLLYRYNRIDKAREYAAEYGYKGAMFPWQSGSDGREETQIIHLNPISGEWGDDYSSLQRHVSLSIAYNIWQYYNITNDIQFMESYGAEMYLEICRFWESKAHYNPKTSRYSIDKVMGPDEFHESYPNATEGGIRDNAYTNLMTSWMFSKAETILNSISNNSKKELAEKINFQLVELEQWQKIQRNLNLVIDNEGIISQYDGYFDLKELDWDYYRNKYSDVHRMDRVLKAEGKSADDYKVSKQADMLMIYYNLNNEEVSSIISDLNYELPENYLEKNLNYYLQRTSHGSTLSRVVHAQLANIIHDKELSWELYQDALTSDYNDIQGGTTAEGIHAGVMAGTVMIAISTFAGVDIRGDKIIVNPCLPKHWKKIEFSLTFKNVFYSFVISHDDVDVSTDKDAELIINGKKVVSKKSEN